MITRRSLVLGFLFPLLVALALQCGPKAAEVQGRARNVLVGGDHALALSGCLDVAKASDAGAGSYAVYETCAADVDARFGRKNADAGSPAPAAPAAPPKDAGVQ